MKAILAMLVLCATADAEPLRLSWSGAEGASYAVLRSGDLQAWELERVTTNRVLVLEGNRGAEFFWVFGASGPARIERERVSVLVAWDASPDPSVTGYAVYYGVQSGCYTNRVAARRTMCRVAGLERNTTYFFVVVATNAVGMESEPSNEVWGRGL